MVYWKNTAYENQTKAILFGKALLSATTYRFLQLMQTENAKLARSNRMVTPGFIMSLVFFAILTGTSVSETGPFFAI